jgi:hypothetical protein
VVEEGLMTNAFSDLRFPLMELFEIATLCEIMSYLRIKVDALLALHEGLAAKRSPFFESVAFSVTSVQMS